MGGGPQKTNSITTLISKLQPLDYSGHQKYGMITKDDLSYMFHKSQLRLPIPSSHMQTVQVQPTVTKES